MKKMAITLAVAAGLGLSGLAMAGQTGKTQTVTGKLTVTPDCTVALTLNNDNVKTEESGVRPVALITGGTITTTCAGKVWIGPQTQDDKRIGVMTSATKDMANYILTSDYMSYRDEGNKRIMVSNKALAVGGEYTFDVRYSDDGSHGMPTVGKSYSYTVEGGNWTD
ncbi:hypothetical protein [Escherichia coli]|uniref:hypothetical protein n=1 Tax=Escherichia coli TaxID=562 RepID=UPI000BE1BA42|nr:hypothetical protein [Escherichia coli]